MTKFYRPVGDKACVFPVGSIYLSVVNTNPTKWFGGTWVRVADGHYLIGCDPANTWFNKPGEVKGSANGPGNWSTNNTTLSVNQIPAHSHSAGLNNAGGHEHIFWFGGGANSGNGGQIPVANSRWGQDKAGQTDGAHDHGGVWVQNTGGGQGHNHFHVSPYYIVFVWKRTA